MSNETRWPAIAGQLSTNPLFKGLEANDIAAMLPCLHAYIRSYAPGQAVIDQAQDIHAIGIVLSGEATASHTDVSGQRLVLAHHGAGSIFGDVLSANRTQRSPVMILADTAMNVLYVPYDRVLTRCERGCNRHDNVLRNLLDIISGKYFALHERIGYLMLPSLRDKIVSYLEACAEKAGSPTFQIPFDRTEMADYLNADRSALSRELGRLKKEGRIDYYKNSFKLLN